MSGTEYIMPPVPDMLGVRIAWLRHMARGVKHVSLGIECRTFTHVLI